jgi:hypothetical protein
MIFTSPTRKSALKQQGASECPSVNNKKKIFVITGRGEWKEGKITERSILTMKNAKMIFYIFVPLNSTIKLSWFNLSARSPYTVIQVGNIDGKRSTRQKKTGDFLI